MKKSRTTSDAAGRRAKLCKRIVKLVAPEGMTYAQYVIECAAAGIEVSLENGMFLHWLLTRNGIDAVTVKVRCLLIKAVEEKWLIDPSNEDQVLYFIDAMTELVMMNKDYCTKMYDAVLKTMKKTVPDIFIVVKKLNKAFGFTSTEYFS